MQQSIRLGRIGDIVIGLHYTWLVVFFLVTWGLAGGYFPRAHPEWSPGLNWGVGLTTSLLFFGSVLLHELGHSLVSVRRGIPVRSITLFIFGGVASIEREPQDPMDEVAITAAGPAVSLGLAAVFWLLTQVLGFSPVAVALCGWLATINLSLGLFNLLPGFPLDGGRLLRALVWRTTGDYYRATRVATWGGLVVAYGFIGIGLWLLMSGALVDGLWLAFLGWFLVNAAEGQYQLALTRKHLRGVAVSTLVAQPATRVNPALSVAQLVDDYFLGRGCRAALVERPGELLGIITLTDVKRVPRDDWATESVQRWMTPSPLVTVQAREDIAALMQLMATRDIHSVPVLDGDRIVGMVDRSDVIRYLQTRQELGV